MDDYYYLLKPANAPILYTLLNKVTLSMQKLEEAVTLVYQTSVVRIPYKRIIYLEIRNKKLLFHLENGSIQEISGSLATYESKMLQYNAFTKIHRSFLVNMNYIKEINHKDVILIPGDSLPLSRLIYTQIRTQYMDYLFKESGIE